MVSARALAQHPAALALKPPEICARELVLPDELGGSGVQWVAPDGPSVLLIVARYKEDVSWLKSLPALVEYHVVQKCALQPELAAERQTLLPNVGRESHSYLTHLLRLQREAADGRVALPLLLVCVQADPFEHNSRFLDELDVLAGAAARGVAAYFTPLGLWSGGERIIYCDASGAPHQPKLLPIARTWRALFGEARPLPLWLGFTPGALFALSCEALLRTPTAVLEAALGPEGGLSSHADPIAGHVFERLWRYLFVDHEGPP